MDPIANMIAMLNNSSIAKHFKVDIPYSKFKLSILNVLKDEGYIQNLKIIKLKNISYKHIRVYLKYLNTGNNSISVISKIKILSKQSIPMYRGVNNIPRFLNSFGTVIISTSQGVMSDKEARSKNLGGKLICYVS